MFLITETIEQTTPLVESAGEKKNFFIEGIFLQSNIKNRNGRVYPKHIMEKEVARYKKEKIDKKIAYGELGHPSGPTINPDRISHLIVELREDGDNYIGKAKLLNTPMGNIAKGIIEDGGVLGVSSRGMGSLKPNKQGIMEVQDDFFISTAGDIVTEPSAPDAFVNGIMENVNWIYDAISESWIAQNSFDKIQSEAKKQAKKSVKEMERNAAKLFEQFLNSLTKK